MRALIYFFAGIFSVPALACASGHDPIQLTSGKGNDTEAAWSPDGGRIVFQSDRDGRLHLFLLDTATKELKPLVGDPGHSAFPAWSPDGKWIAYSHAHFTRTAFEGQEDGYNLFMVPADGGTPRRLTFGRCRDYAPAFLPDGKTIIFSSDRAGIDKSNAVGLYRMSVEGGGPEAVLQFQENDHAAVQATFSNDGRTFAYAALAGFRDNWRIRLAHSEFPDASYPLTDTRDCFYGPRWSPAGPLLACTGFRVGDDGWGVWLLDARTGRRVRLGTGPGNSRGAAWSPDGRHLVFENNRSGSYKLYRIEAPTDLPAEAAPNSGDAGQVLHYSFGSRPEGKVVDLSPRGNDAAISGAAEWAGGSMRFIGPKSWIAIEKPKGLDFGSGAFAVRAIVEVPDDCRFAMIVMGQYPGNRLGWQLFIDDQRRANFNSRSADLTYRGARSDEPVPSRWPVTLTGVRDASGRVRLYVDGAPQRAMSADAFYAYGQPTQVRVGTQHDGSAPFPGRIHDVSVYARELSANEMRGDSLARFWQKIGRPSLSATRAGVGSPEKAPSPVPSKVPVVATAPPPKPAPPASQAAGDGAKKRFEVAAWVDHFDFSTVYDTEKAEGLAQILDHVRETGATTILWRNCGGSTMRYQSQIEAHHNPSQIDKRRIAYGRHLPSWVRYGEAEPDIVSEMVRLCKERGLRPGIHWPFEETHWQVWTIGEFNLEHPQYWGRDAMGQPWWGRVSLAHPAAIRHKLALIDELLRRGVEVLFIDFWRTGGWSPAYEYIDPVVAAYKEKYGAPPSADPKDPVWCRHVAGYVTEFLRAVRSHLKASGRTVELAVGIPEIAPTDDGSIIRCGADWRRWIDEGLIDTLMINYVKWDKAAPMESTQSAYRQIMDVVAGRCDVWCPVQQYNFGACGLPAYQQATGKSPEELAAMLARMAHGVGASGIGLECVDYNNYGPAVRETLRNITASDCRWVIEARPTPGR